MKQNIMSNPLSCIVISISNFSLPSKYGILLLVFPNKSKSWLLWCDDSLLYAVILSMSDTLWYEKAAQVWMLAGDLV